MSRDTDRMIVAYSRSDGAVTNYEIAWVTVALRHLRAGDDSWIWIDPVHRWLQTYGLAGAARARGRPGVPARLGELAARSRINACSADPRWEATARFCGVAAKVLHYPTRIAAGCRF